MWSWGVMNEDNNYDSETSCWIKLVYLATHHTDGFASSIRGLRASYVEL